MKHQNRSELVAQVIAEMVRVWGPAGFDGSDDGYAWLNDEFGITEEDDLRWQDVLSEQAGTLDVDTEDLDDDERSRVNAFLKDEPAVKAFLDGLLQRYRSSGETFRR